jgi:hypothetical protein
MPAEAAVNAILAGIKKNKKEIYVGIAKLIPWISGFSPALMKYILTLLSHSLKIRLFRDNCG